MVVVGVGDRWSEATRIPYPTDTQAVRRVQSMLFCIPTGYITWRNGNCRLDAASTGIGARLSRLHPSDGHWASLWQSARRPPMGSIDVWGWAATAGSRGRVLPGDVSAPAFQNVSLNCIHTYYIVVRVHNNYVYCARCLSVPLPPPFPIGGGAWAQWRRTIAA